MELWFVPVLIGCGFEENVAAADLGICEAEARITLVAIGAACQSAPTAAPMKSDIQTVPRTDPFPARTSHCHGSSFG